MYTTDRKVIAKYADGVLQEAGLCLAAAAFCALFAGVYELFSHEVYSWSMIFSFAVPLMLGAFPLLGIAAYAKRAAGEYEGAECVGDDCEEFCGRGICFPGRIARNAWHSGIAALTVGLLFRGVLEIYGTTNLLLTVYFVTAGVLMAIASLSYILSLAVANKKRYHETESDSV